MTVLILYLQNLLPLEVDMAARVKTAVCSSADMEEFEAMEYSFRDPVSGLGGVQSKARLSDFE
jgi:hypothetical protein